jgi:hypothetical protein
VSAPTWRVGRLAPTDTIGSVVIDLPLEFLSIARELMAGTFKPRIVELGIGSSEVRS